MIVVGDQRKADAMLGGERALRLERVGRDADYFGTEGAKIVVAVPKADRLHGASEGESFGIKIEDHRAPAELAETEGAAVRSLGHEVRCDVAFLQHGAHLYAT